MSIDLITKPKLLILIAAIKFSNKNPVKAIFFFFKLWKATIFISVDYYALFKPEVGMLNTFADFLPVSVFSNAGYHLSL